MSVWKDYYSVPSNRRLFPDEDVCRFLSSAKSYLPEKVLIIDLGCGDGRNGAAIRQFYPEGYLHGIDKYLPGSHDAVGPYTLLRNYNYLQREDAQAIISTVHSSHLFLDCMLSQHFSWEDHAPFYREIFQKLRPGGWFFLKHLSSMCTDTVLAEPFDESKFTYQNIPEHPEACYPNNGLVCMPHWGETFKLLASVVGFDVIRSYRIIREEAIIEQCPKTKCFSHDVFFCRRPL